MHIIDGTSGNDNLISQDTDGTDIISGGEGFDILWGGQGKDVFVIHHNDPDQPFLTKTFIQDFQDGIDLVDLSDTPIESFDQLWADQYGEDQYVDTPTVESDWYDPWFSPISPFRIYLEAYEHSWGSNDDAAPVFISPDDFIYKDTPQTWHSNGDDTLHHDRSSVYSVDYGRGGDDTVDMSDARVENGVGFTVNLATGRIEDDAVHHILEFEHVRGSYGRDMITGDDGDNTLSGRGNSDTIHGGGGDDLLYGGYGFDILYGGSGDDRMVGGRGSDHLYGGRGSDVFVMRGNDDPDTVMDFGTGDLLDVSSWGVRSIDELDIYQRDRYTVSVTDGENRVDLRDNGSTFSVDEVSESDFIFDS